MGKTVNPKTMTKFCSKYPDDYIKLCKEGGSTPEFCLEKEISRETFDRWCRNYPRMGDAKRIGKKLAEGWWIRTARNFLVNEHKGPKLDTNLYKFIMGGRFGHTADKSLLDALKAIEAKQDAILAMAPTTAIAEEAEYEETTD